MGHTVWTTVCAVTFWAPLPWCKRDGRGGFLFCVRKLSRCYSLLERVESHSFVARRIILLWRRLINRQRSMVKPFCATRGRQTAHRKQSIVCNCFVCFIFPSLSCAAHSFCLGLVLAIDPPYQMQMQLWIQGQEGTPLKHLGFGTMRQTNTHVLFITREHIYIISHRHFEWRPRGRNGISGTVRSIEQVLVLWYR